MATEDPEPPDVPESNADFLRESAPFLVTSIALFAAGALAYLFGVSWGPTVFPLWALLIALGFIAAIGTAIAWYVAADRAAPTATRPAVVEEDEESGRPRPDVRREAATDEEPWFEGPPGARSEEPAPARGGATPKDDHATVLEEIDRIERETARRPRADAPASH